MQLFAGMEFEQVVRQYADTVYAVCVMRLNNTADAEDCFQDTFLKLCTDPPELRDEEHLKAWLIRVAINRCKNCIRDRRRTVSFEAVPETPSLIPEDTGGDISWALMRLEPKYRDVLYLYYVERYKVAEIGGILGMSESAVKNTLYRGRKKLKKIYGGDDE